MLFVVTLLLFLCSLLMLFSAPTSALWILAILIGEWGHFAALVALILAALSWRAGGPGKANAVFALLTAAICLSPVIRAGWNATALPSSCTKAFGEAADPSRAKPLVLLDLFRGIRSTGVIATEHAYAMNGAKPLTLDLYHATNSTEPQPLVIMLHSGAWKGGSKEELPAMNRYLAQHGYAVASINYRHAPRSPFPAAVDDVFRAIDFLKANAAQLQLDTSRIVMMGRSAGGQIALSAAYAGREPAIRGVVAFYPPADLVLGYNKPSRRWVLDSKGVLEDYLQGAPADRPADYAAASPINFVNAATPPTLLIHGGLDPIVWPIHSDLLAHRLSEAKRPHLLLRLPWATHGCDANLSGPSGQLSLYAIDRFLASAYSKPSSADPTM